MSEPLQTRQSEPEDPRPGLTPDEQATGDGDRGWFHRTAPGPAPQVVTPPAWATPPPGPDAGHGNGRRHALHAVTGPSPAPEPAKPAAPRAPGEPTRQLTQEHISYFLARDPDKFLEEDFYRDLEFDMAIDREPELE
jgi:hypothetical protein